MAHDMTRYNSILQMSGQRYTNINNKRYLRQYDADCDSLPAAAEAYANYTGFVLLIHTSQIPSTRIPKLNKIQNLYSLYYS